MQIVDNVVNTLLQNRLRSLLTLSGVIIGIALVIALLGVGQAVQMYIQSKLALADTNQVSIVSGNYTLGGSVNGGSSKNDLSQKDLELINSKLETKPLASCGLVNVNESVSFGDKKEALVTVKALLGDYWQTYDYTFIYGSKLPERRVSQRQVVLGWDLAGRLSDENQESMVGQTVKIGSIKYKVVGVNKKKGAVGVLNPDMEAFVPLDSIKSKIGNNKLNMISVKAQAVDDIPQIKSEITEILRDARNLKEDAKNPFSIYDSGELLEIFNSIKDIFTALMVTTGALTLVVAGLGIMNIMLSNVTQRTREIGLLKAIGASNTYIIKQFLIESVIITFSGGVVGVVLGTIIHVGTIVIMRVVFDSAIELMVYPGYIVVALIVSALLGVVFGVYPALNAAKLTPIKALRQH